jgi:hypothetical protein
VVRIHFCRRSRFGKCCNNLRVARVSIRDFGQERSIYMKRLRFSALAAVSGIFLTAAFLNFAQDTPNQGNFDPRNIDWANFDPAQFRAQMEKMMMDGYRKRLEVSDDAEWKVIEGRVRKVMEANRNVGFGVGMGALRGFGGGAAGAGRGAQMMDAFGIKPGVEEEALKAAHDSNVPVADLKAALAKFREAQAAKRVALENARAELREVLSVRQEAIATLAGLL